MNKIMQIADIIVTGMVISVDRMEVGNTKSSAFMEVEKEFEIKVYSIVDMNDIIAAIENGVVPGTENLEAMRMYRNKYGVEKMNRNNKYKYFLMDLDGTISDPKVGITKAVAFSLKQYGIEIKDLDSLCDFIGPPLTESFQQYFDFSEEKSKEAVLKYREYYIPYGIYENQLYEGMAQLLKNIVDQGSKIILATSKPTIFAEKILKYFKIDKYFEFVAGSEMDLSRYGKGEVIEYALKKMNINSENAIMIGDRKHDIIGAKENKLASIGTVKGCR